MVAINTGMVCRRGVPQDPLHLRPSPRATPPPKKAILRMNLSFTPNDEDDILNTTIRDSDTGSVMYRTETPKYAGGTLTTTVTRQNQVYGSSRFAFRILWKGTLEDVKIVLDFRTLEEVSVKDILGNAPGSTT